MLFKPSPHGHLWCVLETPPPVRLASQASPPPPPPPPHTHLDDHTALDEVVKGNSATARAVKLADEDVIKSVREAVAKASEGSLELVLVDGARVVTVVAAEGGLPVSDVLPQRTKLLEVDGPGVVSVKHPNHEPHCLRVEGRPRPCSKEERPGYNGMHPAYNTMVYKMILSIYSIYSMCAQ